MNNSFDKYPYSNQLHSSHHQSSQSYLMHDTIEHTFDQRNHHHQEHSETDSHQHDSRTEDQMMNNLNFSIEDLLSKISKATAEFQQPPKFTKPHSKQQYPAVFKLSNLSASTETTSNRQRSDPYIEKYEPNVEGTRKSQPYAQVFSATEKIVRIGLGQKQNSLYQTNPQIRNQQRNQLRSQTYNEWKLPQKNQQQTNNYYIADLKPENKSEPISNQWGRSSSRNQTQPQFSTEWGRNSSRNQPSEEPTQQWGRASSRNQPKVQPIHNFQHFEEIQEWGRNSSRNQQIKTQLNNEWKNPEKAHQWDHNYIKNHLNANNQDSWKNYETQAHDWTTVSQKTQAKTDSTQEFSWRNMHKTEVNIQHSNNAFFISTKKEFTSQPQIQIKNENLNPWDHLSTNSSKNQIKSLLNPFHTSAFGNVNQIRNRVQKKSIILEDDNSNSLHQPVPVSSQGKVNSLFDGRKIREVAASTIIDSPDKNKKLKMQSPFMQILNTNTETIEESTNEHLPEPLNDVPTIKINTVEKSEIVAPQISSYKLTIQDFHLGKQLGSGKFGDVYQAVHKATGALYAIKKIFKSTIQQYNMIEQFTRELKIHYSLNYPNIIKLYTHFDDEYHIFLVMEYGEGGMLMEKINNGEKFSSIIVEQMLRAVEFLHNKKIAHRDIKPENIVIMFGDTAKLCDFGWSRFFDSDMKKTFCGTLDYVSPQMKDKGEYSLKIDIWSLGVLTFELLCGFAPFKDEITNWKKKGGNLNKAWNWNILYPPDISSVSQSFMRNLLKQNPEQRANIRFCLNHLFIRKYNQMSFNVDEERMFREVSLILKDE